MPDKLDDLKVPIDANTVSRTKSADFHSVYVNNANFAVSFFDIRFMFGHLVMDPGEPPRIEDKVAISMSLEHAKALHMALDRVLSNYERDHGPIREKSD
ncbi:MAG TPA: DUF3467 domain-containing protein [Bryobacteraceae bacterium]|nr:DUF3467 domain-containing protein [Bryobacteraceae bacterium]